MAEIAVQDVAKRYRRVEALRGVSFQVTSGEFFCLLAPPGSGKTTLLRLIAGLERPDHGEVFIDGRPVMRLPPAQRDTAMVFEDLALYPHLTGFDNIAHPLTLRRLPPPEVRRRVEQVAEMLGIRHLLGRHPSTFSGGEQQRVAIARAIVREPKILLMDQPLSNLDAKVREAMLGELRHLQQRTRQTTIYATHDYEEAMALGDRLLILHDGRVEQIGTPDEVYMRPATTFGATITGSPPMNLVACRVVDGLASADGLTVPVTGADGDVVLGVRPEEIRFGDGPDAVVDLVQPLGRKKIVDVVIGAVRLKIVAGPQFNTPRGARVRVRFDPQTIRIYDRDGRLTGARAVGPVEASP